MTSNEQKIPDRQLPDAFCERVRAELPCAEPLLEALSGSGPSLSVRTVPGRGFALPADAVRVPWCADGFYLGERPLFAADAGWHSGRYYVQEASSMSMAEAVRVAVERMGAGRSDLRVLDACAAPGGKSLAALSALPAGSFLVANEPDAMRAAALAENIARFGSADVAVTRADARAFGAMKGAFDIIIADMPCSGEGMMRKEEVAVSQWSPALTARCAELQRSIADSLWNALRPGGVMLYSTCTFGLGENEDNIRYMIENYGAEPVELGLDRYDGVVRLGALPAYRFMPGLVRGEGFFIAAVAKPGDDTSMPHPLPRRLPKEAPAATALAVRLLPALADSHIATGTDAFELLPRRHADLIAALDSLKAPRPLRHGLPLGTMKGRDAAPAHETALALALDADAIPRLDLDADAAAAYLRGEAITDVPDGVAKGYVLACHDGMALGWAKNIGRRANNLYPERSRLKLRVELKSIFS